MPSSGQRRKGPGPLTASASYTEAAEQVQVICECRPRGLRFAGVAR
jgi:hypothetical protein